MHKSLLPNVPRRLLAAHFHFGKVSDLFVGEAPATANDIAAGACPVARGRLERLRPLRLTLGPEDAGDTDRLVAAYLA